jgi:transcriptional regulator of arginine metabolism
VPEPVAGVGERRETIRQLLRTQRIGTQEELRERLAQRGFDTTQATLSRDLARIGARRAMLRDGGSYYELGDPATDERAWVTAVEESLALVVVITAPGAASSVALALDRAQLPEVAGTIAGDDTIFVAPSRRTTPALLSRKLKKLWNLKDTP